jgi:hypothetical protein
VSSSDYFESHHTLWEEEDLKEEESNFEAEEEDIEEKGSLEQKDDGQ